MTDLQHTWDVHKSAEWPRLSSPHEGQLMTLDTVISGCVIYFLEHTEALDPQRVEMLESCVADLDDILADLPGDESQGYFNRLRRLGQILLGSLPHPSSGIANERNP
jgi:hypothetical protein